MPNCGEARKRANILLVERLRHESEISANRDPVAVRGSDAGALLPPVLERKEAEEGHTRDLLVGSVDAENTALFMRLVIIGQCRRELMLEIDRYHVGFSGAPVRASR